MLEYENKYLSLGNKFIAGVDEAGRGPLAGPVCVASVIMPLDKNSITYFENFKEISDYEQKK